MHRYISRANVDHFITVLNGSDLTAQHRSTTMSLLIFELDKLGADVEHLEFAENKVADGRAEVQRMRRLRDSFPAQTSEREQAERQLVHAENLHTLLEDFCHRLRARTGARDR